MIQVWLKKVFRNDEKLKLKMQDILLQNTASETTEENSSPTKEVGINDF